MIEILALFVLVGFIMFLIELPRPYDCIGINPPCHEDFMNLKPGTKIHMGPRD